MLLSSKTFRIFVSSTFSDLKEERNALQKNVFPKLRELCMQHGCRFQAIDLRWGVREEAALDQQTMKICLEEIRRCQKVTPRPNFIVLLGDRYGWRPLPYEIPADEFEQILSNISDEGEKELLTCWYWRDDNAVPPVYDLRARTDEFIDSSKWENVERELRTILLEAIKDLPIKDEQRLRYIASATEQEIFHGALQSQNPQEHVFSFFRSIKDIPKNKGSKDFIDIDETGKLDSNAQNKLKELKNHLKGLLPTNVHEYEARWTEDSVTTDHMERMCNDVYSSLSKVILEEISKFEEVDPLQKEIEDHEAFGKERARFFVGRGDILKNIDEYICGSGNHPLAIYGESGSGKTALMAKAVEQTRENYPETEVIYRYIGATPGSSDGRSLLESLCKQIYKTFDLEEQKRQKLADIEGHDNKSQEKRHIETEYEIPSDFQKLSNTVREIVKKIPADKGLILFLDGLDQLSNTDHARNLTWLPSNLPYNVHIVVSALPGDCLSVLEKQLRKENLIKLKPMQLNEGSKLLDRWLDEVGIELQGLQRKEVLDKFSICGLPLYLKLAFEEARRWKSYTHTIALSSDISGIIRDLFKRLSSDTNHGKIMVSRCLGYLAAAKNGLTEDELLDVLSQDVEVFDDFRKRAKHEPQGEKLPIIVWSRLFFDLEPYLTERAADGTSLMSFYHRQLREVVNEEYLTNEVKKARHVGLSQYFGGQPLWIESDKKKNPNIRKVSELPYQETYGEKWDKLETTLCNILFIEAKCAAGMTYDLITDYNFAIDELPEAREEKQKELEHEKRVKKYVEDLIAYAKGEIENLDIIPSVRPWIDDEIKKETDRIINNPTRLDRIKAFSQFVNSESHNLATFGTISGFCLQQAYNSADSGPVTEAAEAIINAEKDAILLLQLSSQRPPYNLHQALLRTMEGHRGDISALDITLDGKVAVSGGSDSTLRIWDLEQGQCLTVIKTDNIGFVKVAADGKRIFSFGKDLILRIWDMEAGECVKAIEQFRYIFEDESFVIFTPESIAITPDGRISVSGGTDRNLRIWDIETSACIKSYTIPTNDSKDQISGLWEFKIKITPQAKTAISSSIGGALRVWDLQTGNYLDLVEQNMRRITSINITPDGKKAVSSSNDMVIREWNLKTGECLKRLKGHQDRITSVCITDDGKIVVSASLDGTLRVWDLGNGNCLKVLKGNIDRISLACITPDGKFAISVSNPQRQIQMWDLECGRSTETSKNHTDSISRLYIVSDGTKAISSSWDGTLCIWDCKNGERIGEFEGHLRKVTCFVITSDIKKLISGSWDGTIRVWDIRTQKCINILRGHETIIEKQPVISEYSVVYQDFSEERLMPVPGWVTDICITPDERRVISGSWDRTIRVWNIDSGECLKILGTPKTDIHSMVDSLYVVPDGRSLISKHHDTLTRIWDIETGKCFQLLNTAYMSSLSILPDGKVIISGSSKGTLHIWNIKSGECLRIIRTHETEISKVNITPDGKMAISGSSRGTLRIWNIKNGECLRTLKGYSTSIKGHSDSIECIKTSSDGRIIVTGSSNGTLKIWNIESGGRIALYRTDGAIKSISNIGTYGQIAFGTDNGEVKLCLLHNFIIKHQIVTAYRIWLYGENENNGRWDDAITTLCPWCGKRFVVKAPILDTVKSINSHLSPDQSPCLELPDEAWDGPRLVSECPLCQKPLKFNPFIVDNRERY